MLGDPIISVEESDWGIRRYVKYPDGKDLTFFFGMPNINFINGQVVDPVIKRADVMVFKVPVDDENHIHFEVRAIALTGERGRAWIEERRAMRAKAEEDRPELVRAILAGKLRLSDIDPKRIDFVMLEDEIAQTGQGADRRARQRTFRPQRPRRVSSAQDLGTGIAKPSGRQTAKNLDLSARHGADLSGG